MIFKVEQRMISQISRLVILNLDRCASTKCREGETCVLNKDGDAECACIAQCEDPKDERLMVRLMYTHSILHPHLFSSGLHQSKSYLYIGL